MHTLISYIIEEPEDPTNQLKSCKFPMIASEFFSSDLPCVPDIIFKEPDLMRYLFSFVEREGDLNFLLSGYFLKAYECCLAHNSDEFLLIIFQEAYHTALLKHIKSSSIAEIISSILGSESRHEEKQDMLRELIERLASADYMTSFNSAQVISRLNKDEDTFQRLLQQGAVDKIFSFLQVTHTWVVRNAGNVLKFILNSSGEVILPFVAGKVGYLVDVLQREPLERIPTAFGVEIKPFGEDRLMALELCSILCNFPVFHQEIGSYLEKILGLFPEYLWSSYFHNAFTIFIENIVASSSSLLITPLVQSGFPQTLIEMASNSSVDCRKFTTQIGSIGHVYKILNILTNSKIPLILDFIESQSGWTNFEEKLALYNEAEAKSIGGKANMNFFDNMSSEDSGERCEEPDFIPE